MKGVYDLGIGLKIDGRSIRVEMSGLNIEDVNKDTNVAEDLVLLACEVVLCEGVLTKGKDCQ